MDLVIRNYLHDIDIKESHDQSAEAEIVTTRTSVQDEKWSVPSWLFLETRLVLLNGIICTDCIGL